MNLTDKITVYNMDCMDYMAGLEDNAFNLSITDPPYNVGRKYNEYDDNLSEKDYHKWCDSWFSELIRVSETVVMTVGYKNLHYWFSKKPKHQVIWSKPNQNSPSPLGGFNAYESILVWGKNHKRIGHDIFVSNIAMQPDASFHDCPKHLQSWKKITKMFIDSPCIIFDPFLGSGTSAIVCNYLDYEFVGCELDPDYYNDMIKRFREVTSQQTFF